MNPQQPTNQPQQPTPMQGAMTQQQQPQQPTPSIDPALSKSIIDNLKSQSQQIEQAQGQIEQSDDAQAQQANQMLRQKQQTISKALGQLQPNSKDTQAQVGQAISSPAYAGYCQQFVDDQTGANQRYATAADTWQAKVADGSAQTNLNNVKVGDVIEFAPDQGNGNMGHAALVTSTKNGVQLKMATNQGVQSYSFNDWLKWSGQVPQGFYSPSN